MGHNLVQWSTNKNSFLIIWIFISLTVVSHLIFSKGTNVFKVAYVNNLEENNLNYLQNASFYYSSNQKELFSRVPVIHTTSPTIEKNTPKWQTGLVSKPLSRLRRMKGLRPLQVQRPQPSVTQKPARRWALLKYRSSVWGKKNTKNSPTREGCQQNLPRKKKYLRETPSNLPGEHKPELDQLEGNRHSGIRRQNHRAHRSQGCQSINGRRKSSSHSSSQNQAKGTGL